jgi:hypothetical protein
MTATEIMKHEHQIIEHRPLRLPAIAAALVIIVLLGHGRVLAHCDTLNGPVVTDARQALEKGELTLVLKWVKKERETEIRDAFKRTLAVRSKGADARELADLYFFETVVRIHRAGEGAPYTGLKPAETELDPAVAAGDQALTSGSVDGLVKMITDLVAAGIRERFKRTLTTQEHAGHNVEAGREFVAAYVDFVHYAERLYTDAKGQSPHHHEAEEPAGAHENAEHK